MHYFIKFNKHMKDIKKINAGPTRWLGSGSILWPIHFFFFRQYSTHFQWIISANFLPSMIKTSLPGLCCGVCSSPFMLYSKGFVMYTWAKTRSWFSRAKCGISYTWGICSYASLLYNFSPHPQHVLLHQEAIESILFSILLFCLLCFGRFSLFEGSLELFCHSIA